MAGAIPGTGAAAETVTMEAVLQREENFKNKQRLCCWVMKDAGKEKN